jgi:hypothetical protein
MNLARRLLRLLIPVACALGSPHRSAAAAGPAGDEVVELPPLEVIAPGKPLPPWLYARVGRLDVLSRCSAGLTREFIETHARLTQLLQQILPVSLQVELAAPQIVILTDQTTTPAAARDAVLGFSGPTPAPAAGRGAMRERQVRFVPNLRLNDVDKVAIYAILDSNTFSGDRLMLTANHVHDVLERRTPPLPSWFMVGLLTLYQDIRYLHDALELAPLDWVTPAETELLRIDPDYPRTLLPMREFFAGVPARNSADPAPLVRLWQAQAALFMRWALEGGDPARRAGFHNLVARAAAAPVDETMVRECLGLGYADLRDRLSDLLPGTLRNRLRLRVEKILPVPPFKLQTATPDEIGRIKGDWERMEIAFVKARHPQYADKYVMQAHRTLTEAFEKGQKDPQLLAVIGLFECDIGNGMAARSFLEDAARAQVVRPRVYLELARLRQTEATGGQEGEKQALGPNEANRILEPLATGWNQAPPLMETYLLAAQVWARSQAALSPKHLALLDEGRRLFPRNLSLTYYTALLKGLHGDPAGAAALIAHGMRHAPTEAARKNFEQLQTYLQRQAEAAPRP